MGSQEGHHEASGSEAAENGGTEDPQDRSLAGCLDDLLDAAELHRLVFLCVGGAVGLPPEYPRKPPRVMGTGGPRLPEEVSKEQLAGAGKDFILRLRPRLERHALDVLNRLGTGKEQYWYIDTDGAYYLQGTSTRILNACRGLSAIDVAREYTGLVDAAIRVAYDHNRTIWTAGKIRWEYLEGVDSIIKDVTIATVHACRTGIAACTSGKPSRTKPSRNNTKPGSPRRFTRWKANGDTCFVIDDRRVKLHYGDEFHDLRLKIRGQTYIILNWLSARESISAHEICEACGTATKAFHVIRNSNDILNKKTRQLALPGMPEGKTAFIEYRSALGGYASCIPVMTRRDFDHREVKEIVDG